MKSQLEYISVFATVLLFAYMALEAYWVVKKNKMLSFQVMIMPTIKTLGLTAVFVVILRVVGVYLSATTMIYWGYHFRIAELELNFLTVILGVFVYEFLYWLNHFLGHKVRLFWCIHSTHHTPENMGMPVAFQHSIFESLIYTTFFTGFLPAFMGFPIEFLLVMISIDMLWGSFLHIHPSIHERFFRKHYGRLENIMQTPNWHLVHHSRNPQYIDKNFAAITQFWDWVFRTRQPIDPQNPPELGITREVDPLNVWDIQFKEFFLLYQDVKKEPYLMNKLKLIFMPPGWRPISSR